MHPGRTIAYDDDQHPTLAVDPVFPDDEQDETEVRVARLETIRSLVAWITSGRVGPVQIGRRCLLVAHTLDGQRGSQRRLAKRLGVTESQVSQALKRLRAALRQLADGSGT